MPGPYERDHVTVDRGLAEGSRAGSSSRNRPHKPASDEMGPHNWGGGEGLPATRARKPTFDRMGIGTTGEAKYKGATAKRRRR